MEDEDELAEQLVSIFSLFALLCGLCVPTPPNIDEFNVIFIGFVEFKTFIVCELRVFDRREGSDDDSGNVMVEVDAVAELVDDDDVEVGGGGGGKSKFVEELDNVTEDPATPVPAVVLEDDVDACEGCDDGGDGFIVIDCVGRGGGCVGLLLKPLLLILCF